MSTGSTTAETGSLRFSRDVMWTMGARLMIAASSMLTGIIVARWLGASAVGVLAALAVVTMLAITVGSAGLSSSITFLVAREKSNTRSVLINAVLFGMVSGVVLAAALFAVAVFRPQLLPDVPPTLLIIVAAAVPVQMITAFCLAVYLGLERIRTYNIIDLSLQGVVLLNALFTLIVAGAGLYTFVIVAAAANVVIGLIVLLLIDRQTRSDQPHRPLMRQMLRTGSKFFAAVVAGLIILRGDLLIVNYFRGSEEAGVYAIATQIATFLHMMPNVISTILFPRTAGARDDDGSLTCRVTRHVVVVMILLCTAAIPLVFLVPMLYGEAFASVPMLFLILLPGVFLLGIETVQVQHFSGQGLPRVIPIFWLATLILNVGLNIWLVPLYGAPAAAAASSISYAFIFILIARYFHSKTGKSYSEAFLIRMPEVKELVAVARTLGRRPSVETR